MSEKYPGGFLTATAPTQNPSLGGAVNGLWTLDQAAYAAQTQSWAMYDPYWKNVTLLLNGENAANGAQNNTFLDSSSNNFTITRNGNTTQGTFSPYGSLWSNYFDGTDDRLAFPTNSSAAIEGNAVYTLEGWFYLTAHGGGTIQTTKGILCTTPSAVSNSNWHAWGFYNSTQLIIGTKDGASYVYPTVTGGVQLNQWFHMALVGSSSGGTIYINGVNSGTWSDATAWSSVNTNIIEVGALYGSNALYNGYISNLRFVKGTAVYTSNFTPSATPLTAISGTSLLTCQSNRFKDNSSNNFAITVYGNTSVRRFSPFNPTAPYSTSTIGGSGYFDGNGDYLSIANQSALHLGGGDFAIECWTYLTSTSGAQRPISQNNSNYEFAFYIDNGGGIAAWSFQASGTQNFVISGGTLTTGQWYHLACTRTGSTVALYVNGVRQGTATFSGTVNSQTAGWSIGAHTTYPDYSTGYISDARLLFGSNPYGVGTTITVPTSPLTAITNTQLLTNFTNAGIPDAAMMNDLETVGNVQISTSVKKYGTGSLAFDGTGDYLTFLNNQPSLNFGSGDFTIEFWVYHNVLKDYSGFIGGITASNTIAIYSYANGKCGVTLLTTGEQIGTATGVFSATTWQHVALVRSSGVVTIYIGGVSRGTYTSSSTMSLGGTGGGSIGTAAGTGDFNGYIDDLRITKGYARYTANFTPPTSSLQNL